MAREYRFKEFFDTHKCIEQFKTELGIKSISWHFTGRPANGFSHYVLRNMNKFSVEGWIGLILYNCVLIEEAAFGAKHAKEVSFKSQKFFVCTYSIEYTYAYKNRLKELAEYNFYKLEAATALLEALEDENDEQAKTLLKTVSLLSKAKTWISECLKKIEISLNDLHKKNSEFREAIAKSDPDELDAMIDLYYGHSVKYGIYGHDF